MNLIKLTSTDFLAGRIVLSGKALLDLLWFLIRNPQAKSLRLAGFILQLIPKHNKDSGKTTDKPPSLGTKDKQAGVTRRYSRVRGVEWGSAAIMSVADRDNETSGKIRKPGCREAVTDYLKEHQIQGVVLKKTDLHGVYFQKPRRRKRETVDN